MESQGPSNARGLEGGLGGGLTPALGIDNTEDCSANAGGGGGGGEWALSGLTDALALHQSESDKEITQDNTRNISF